MKTPPALPGLDWPAAREAYRAGTLFPGALAARYLLGQARLRAGRHWLQGPRQPALPCQNRDPAVRLLAAWRVWRIEEAAVRGLIGWAEGRCPGELCFHAPTAGELLDLQSRGRRCVSLLEGDSAPPPYQGGLEFAVHDLCHLEKFADPEHYTGQVGFFLLMREALAGDNWRRLENHLDATWLCDRDHVVADMNGSPLFLLATLKMKLREAVGRCFPHEDAAGQFQRHLGSLLDGFGIPNDLRPAAALVHGRQIVDPAVGELGRFLDETGRGALGAV